MRYNYKTLLITLSIGIAGTAFAAAPDLLPPTSMQVDPGNAVIAKGLDFLDAPLSGAVNFTPQNYDIHLPGKMIIPAQDVVPFFSVQEPIQDCQGLSTSATAAIIFTFDTITKYIFPKILGVNNIPANIMDPVKFFNGIMGVCNQNPALIDQLQTQGSFPKQIVADVRNSSAGATDILFSGQLLDPYTDFPMVPFGYAGTIIGGGNSVTKDIWNDGIVMAGYESTFPNFLGVDVMNSSLYFYRFSDAGKKALKLVNLSTAWLDKPTQTNGKVTNPCFKGDPNDKNNPVTLKTNAELLADGCVGESHPVAIATPHLYTNTNAALEAQNKSKDLVVLSRSPMGDPYGNPSPKIGYLTIYKRTDKVPDDTSIFQDLWQFDKSVTNSQFGIPEPYGIAVVKNWDATAGKFTEGVVAGSNKMQGTRSYVYYYTNDGTMTEPRAIQVGDALDKSLPGFGGYGAYRVYSADVNGDRCGDIFITRAKIDAVGKTIQFADYFDVHIQEKGPNGACSGKFSLKGNSYQITPVNPNDPLKLTPQISSLAMADFNKDGRIDVIAGDFTTYIDAKVPQNRVNYVYFLEYIGGIFNTMQPPHFIVNTKTHGDDVGVIDVKADAFANLGAVTGNAMMFEEVTIPPPVVPVISKTCGTDGLAYDPTWVDIVVDPNTGAKNDIDGDGIPDCKVYLSGGKPTTGSCKMKCDDCSVYNLTDPAACKADPSKCANPDQIDTDGDHVGDKCDKFPNDNTQSKLAPKKHIHEDKVIYANDQPVIAYQKDLKLTGNPLPVDNGHEVTVLLNKTNVKGTPPACQTNDWACICTNNPSQPPCPCLKDPNGPGCKTTPMPQVSCCLDVCRGDLTSPFPALCDFIKPYNDQIRKITGLCMDVLVPVEGTQYHLSCTMPNAPAAAYPGKTGIAYAQVFKAAGGQIPKNYFKNWLKPVASQNLLANTVLLNPMTEAASGGAALDLSPLPKPDFSFDASLSAISPDISINQAPGITQIDGIMQIETFQADFDPATGLPVTKQAVVNPGVAVPPVTKALLLDIKGFSSPSGCQWDLPDCPDQMQNPPSPQEFVDAIQAMTTAYETAGKPITNEMLNEAFGSMNVGPAFLHQKFVVAGNQGAMMVSMQYAMPVMGAEGGCGCSIETVSSMHNTVLPLVMAASALGGMFALRRKSAKKR